MKQALSPPSLFEKKLQQVTTGQQPHLARKLVEDIPKENAQVIVDYVIAMKSEINPTRLTVRNLLKELTLFSKRMKHKPFKKITRAEVLLYLESHKKDESEDPLHQWIGTYNMRKALLAKFYKWLYHPKEKAEDREEPPQVVNIRSYRRKETSIYQPEDLWTQEEDLLFLKYCPDERIACYHSMSRDSSARPHELLKLKIRDIQWKQSPTGVRYAQVVVSGKTTQRVLPLTNSIPYIKNWLDAHPLKSNPDAPLFTGTGRTLGRPLTSGGLLNIYNCSYKKGSFMHGKHYEGYFQRLLKNPSVPKEDKKAIEKLLQKRYWCPYIRRHSALSEKVRLVKNDFVLKQHAGWGLTSKMINKYIHLFGGESANKILEEMGILPKEGETVEDKLRPKLCTNCSAPNAHDALICTSCRMALTYSQYAQTLESEKKLVEQQIRDEVKKQVSEILAAGVDFNRLG